METKIVQCINKGMQRDYSMDKSSQEYAYENKNIRILSTGDNSALSISNEKSTTSFTSTKAIIVVNVVTTGIYITLRSLQNTESNKLHLKVGLEVNSNTKIKQVEVELGEQIYIESENVDTKYFIESEDKAYIVCSGSNVTVNNSYIWLSDAIVGTIIGSATINNDLILFTTNTDADYIYKLDFSDIDSYTVNVSVLYTGNLGFDAEYPIECIVSYESEEIQKVYWVDGINQPRVINVAVDTPYTSDTCFDFSPKSSDIIDVTIQRENTGAGNFPSGIIQYFITCYKKFGQETHVAYQSPLYYISPSTRGGKVNEIQTCSFKLNITPKTNDFDYVKVYSVIRTSLNTEPIASIVTEENIKNNDGNIKPIQIIDNNYSSNIPISPTDIFFLGGNAIIASTIEQKDGTLFLGGITELTNDEDFSTIKNKISSLKTDKSRNFTSKVEEVHLPEDILKFKWKVIGQKEESLNSQYPYYNQLNNNSSEIKGFKHREVYRFGIQLQTDVGEWTQTIWLDDLVCDKAPKILTDFETSEYSNDDYYLLEQSNLDSFTSYLCLPYIWFNPSSILNDVDYSKYPNYRLVMVEPSNNDRSILCQGYVNPTLYNTTLGHVNSWNLKPVTENSYVNKHLNNVNELDDSFPTPNHELDYSLYDEETRELQGYNTEVSILENSWNISEIATSYSCDSRDTGFDGRTIFKFTLVNKDNTIETTLKSKNVFSSFRYQAYTLSKEYALNYTYNQTLLDEEGNAVIVYDYLKQLVNNNEIQNIKSTDTILLHDGEYPFLTKKESKKERNYTTEPVNSGRLINPSVKQDLKDSLRNHYIVDASICTLNSPDIKNISKAEYENLKFRIVGKTDFINNVSHYVLQSDNSVDGQVKDYLYDFDFNGNFNEELKTFGLKSYPLWYSYARSEEDSNFRINWVYLWNKDNLSNAKTGAASTIKTKTFSNLWFGKNTDYYIEETNNDITNVSKIIWEYPLGVKNIKFAYNDKTYISNDRIYHNRVEDSLIPVINPRYAYMAKLPASNINPYDYKDSVLDDADFNLGAVTIKYNSTEHVLFEFNKSYNDIISLPGYNNNIQLTFEEDKLSTVYDIIEDKTYPAGAVEIPSSRVLQTWNADLSNYISNDIFDYQGAYQIYGNQIDTSSWNNGDFVIIAERVDEGTAIGININHYIYIYNTDIRNNRFLTKLDNFQGDKNIYYNKLTSKQHWFMSFSSSLYNKNRKYIIKATPENYTYTIGNTLSVSNIYSNLRPSYTLKNHNLPWFKNNITDNQTRSTINNSVWIGEFYKDFNDYEPYGGTSENALELNVFIPISNPTNILECCNGLEGDTYFQRWDSLRTYPITEEDKQSVVDVVSLMLETHINLDGRSDVTRGRTDISNIRPSNILETNNEVYSQSNNFITSAILDQKFEIPKHVNGYMWSLTKSPTEFIDTWTNINLNSFAELDGDKGALTKIKRWNNKLLAFQERGIAIINFNQQTTISSDAGVPIEISNSGKVTGHYYLSSTQGCKNKWSITESPGGLYFIDSYNKSINLLNEGITSLSMNLLFQDWIEANEKGGLWTPIINSYNGFKSFYDPIHKDVYFVNKKYCLCYNELLQQFVSFYDYQGMDYMHVLGNDIISVHNNSLYKMFGGTDYCNLFEKQRDYYIQYKINTDFNSDKTWTNLEYRADIFNSGNIQNIPNVITNETFDTLKVWNEYQEGFVRNNKMKYSDFTKKFRIWRVNIPRDSKDNRGLNRIRNPWIMLELKKDTNTNKRLEFHDLLVKYLV